MAYYVTPSKKVGDTSPVSPTKLHPCKALAQELSTFVNVR